MAKLATPKKRVLIYSIGYHPHIGGAEVAVEKITVGIRTIEWTMITLDLYKNLPAMEQIGSILVYRVRCPKIFFPFVGFWKGVKLYTEQPFDIVWSIMTYAGFAALFMRLWFGSDIKFLLTLQEGTPLAEIKRKTLIAYPLLVLMFKKADQVQAISEFLAAFGRDMGHTKDVVVVPNGVDLKYFSVAPKKTDQYALIEKLGKKPGDIFLITTSRLVKKNAIDDCITALTYLPEYIRFLIVGKGEEEQRLRALAIKLGVRERVTFLGFLPQQDIPLFLAVSDIFVRPSRSEGFGNSFIEAMAAGKPVVTTPVGGIPDFIDDRETGIFCRPDNPKSLSEAIMEIVNNRALQEKIIRQGRERVMTRYGWPMVVEQMKEKVFRPLLQE